jgi:hypothetical protein
MSGKCPRRIETALAFDPVIHFVQVQIIEFEKRPAISLLGAPSQILPIAIGTI